MGHYYKSGPGGRPNVVGAVLRGIPLVFEVPKGLFSSDKVDKGTELLAEFLEIPEEGKVLDVGCGYGVLGILMAKLNPKLDVYMVDINPKAVEACKRNAELNDVKVHVFQGNLYEPLDEAGIRDFATIVSNPPLAAGREVVKEIIVGAKDRLVKGGSLQIVMAAGGKWAEELMKNVFGNVERKRKKDYTLLRSYKL